MKHVKTRSRRPPSLRAQILLVQGHGMTQKCRQEVGLGLVACSVARSFMCRLDLVDPCGCKVQRTIEDFGSSRHFPRHFISFPWLETASVILSFWSIGQYKAETSEPQGVASTLA
ncbi:hypothetical protein PM082_021265 [Marasmius tenuissimus]|nr:hypothetical protein PM082_021265 [Marasmius tenuissimus]